MKYLLSCLGCFLFFTVRAQSVFSVFNDWGYSFENLVILKEECAPAIYDFIRKIEYKDVTICLSSDSSLNSVRTDYKRKIVYVSSAMFEAAGKDVLDSIRMDFLLIKEISKVFLYNSFSGFRQGQFINDFELELRSEYLAWLYCINKFSEDANSMNMIIENLVSDLNIRNIGLSISSQQRRYIITMVRQRKDVFNLNDVKYNLSQFDRIIHPDSFNNENLYVFTINGESYDIKRFDEVYAKKDGFYKKQGYIQFLNSEVWYYRVKIVLVDDRYNAQVFFVDDSFKVYNSLHVTVGLMSRGNMLSK